MPDIIPTFSPQSLGFLPDQDLRLNERIAGLTTSLASERAKTKRLDQALREARVKQVREGIQMKLMQDQLLHMEQEVIALHGHLQCIREAAEILADTVLHGEPISAARSADLARLLTMLGIEASEP